MYIKVKEINKKTAVRLAIFSLAAIGVVIFVFFITLTRPNYPQYCAKCHSSITFNNTCKKPSGNITCVDCHTHNNKVTPVMAVEIKNEHCTAEPCHPIRTLSAKASSYKNIKPFQHRTHVCDIAGNFKLRCTSCHSGLGGKKHFETDEMTCDICHFINTQKSIYAQDKNPDSDCTLCHGHIAKTKEIYGKTFHHDMYEENENVRCSDCHFQTIQGYGEADKKYCLQCHSSITDIHLGTSDIHDIHIDKYKTACTSCHASIKHGWPQTSNTIYEDSNPESINRNNTIQNLIMMGEGGKGVKGEPDPMHLATLNCSACHKNKRFSANVTPEVCNNCHKKGFDRILSGQMHFTASGMRLLKTLLVKAKRHNTAGNTVIQEAEVNYKLIKEDGSFGAHNIKYVKDLLNYSIENVKQVSKKGRNASSYRNKQEAASVVSFQEYRYPVNSCTDRCHVNYATYRTVYQEKIFQHKTHSPDKGLKCSRCHNNDPVNIETHGKLIIQKKDCTACHHKKIDKLFIPSSLKDNKNFGKFLISPAYHLSNGILRDPTLDNESLNENDCHKCHTDTRDYINGDFKNVIPKITDWMYKAVSCTDCHKLELDGYSFRSVREYCVKCHNPDYGLLYDAWQETLNRKAEQICNNGINGNVKDLLKLVQSQGMHNFRLSQILLRSVEQIKEKEKIN